MKAVEFKIETVTRELKHPFVFPDAALLVKTNAFLHFNNEKKTYSSFCTKCNLDESDIPMKEVVEFVKNHDELFRVSNKYAQYCFFKCNKEVVKK